MKCVIICLALVLLAGCKSPTPKPSLRLNLITSNSLSALTPDEIATGEYFHLMRRHDSVFEIMSSKPVYKGNHAIKIFAGAHSGGWIDTGHIVHIGGSNGGGELGTGNSTGGSNGYPTITKDSAGNLVYFADVVCGQTNTQVGGSYWWNAGLSVEGDVYVWGIVFGGICGNGTSCAMKSPAPVKVPLPAGIRAVEICAGWFLLIRDQNGDVWTVGGKGNVNDYALGQGNNPNYYSPVKLSLPAPARLIAGATLWSYAVLVNGTIYMWCSNSHLKYATIPEGGPSQNTPKDITGNLPFHPADVTEIKTNNYATYVIAKGILYTWGGREMGTQGDGTEIDFARYGGYPTPYGTQQKLYYAYDQGYNETSAGIAVVIQVSPINPTPGKTNWLHIWTVPCGYCYQAFGCDGYGQIFFCGRNKVVVPNGIGPWAANNGAMQSHYPNSWDWKYWGQVFVVAENATVYGSPCPDCLPGGAHLWPDACNLYPASTPHTPPVPDLVLTAFQAGGVWYVKSDGSGTTGKDVIVHYVHRGLVHDTALDMGVADRPIDTISSAKGVPLAPGQVVEVTLTAINNYFDSASITKTITIPSGNPCPPCPDCPPCPQIPPSDARIKSWEMVMVDGIGRIQVTYWDSTKALLP